MDIPGETVVLAVAAACALFAFGYAVGHALGKRDGEATVADYYADRTRMRS